MTARCENVLVVAETIEGRASDLSYELLGLARQLVQGSGGVVSAAVLERSTAPCIQDLGARGADQVFSISDDRVTAYSAERWLAALPTLLAEHQPGHIVLGHTALGAELGPILAFRVESGKAQRNATVLRQQGTREDHARHLPRSRYSQGANERSFAARTSRGKGDCGDATHGGSARHEGGQPGY